MHTPRTRPVFVRKNLGVSRVVKSRSGMSLSTEIMNTVSFFSVILMIRFGVLVARFSARLALIVSLKNCEGNSRIAKTEATNDMPDIRASVAVDV